MKKIFLIIFIIICATKMSFGQNTTVDYIYDDLNRLVEVSYSNGVTITYTYDALGNRLSKTITGVAQAPVVTTTNVSQIGSTTATTGGNVTSDGGTTVTARGICWSTTHNPTVSGSHTTNGSGTGSFTSSLTNLSPNTTYYVRAYATNSTGTSYGEEKTFTTTCNTLNIQISGNSSVNYGQSVTLTASGASTYSWSTGQSGTSISVSPTISTTYSVTGTATNGCTGTASKLVTVIAQAPVVTTTNVSQIGSTTATAGGNVTSDGGTTVTARGVCWSTTHHPTVSSSHTTNGSGTGSFTSSLTNLSPNTTYYIRAYATNSAGTSYGEEKTFTTSCNTLNIQISGNTSISYGQSVTLTASGASTYSWSTGQSGASITVSPTSTTTYSVTGTDTYGCSGTASKTISVLQTAIVTTANISNIGSTSATCGGSITANGIPTVTARGVCWSTTHNPTVLDQTTTDGTGAGTFTSHISNLSVNTTYHVRAYATNSAGISYGEEKTFTTSCNTVNVQIAGNASVNFGQSVTLTASGASTYTWSTGQSGASITVTPSSTTTYSVTGTDAYGCTGTVSKLVTVIAQAPVVTTTNITGIGSTSAASGGNVTSDGGATVTARGVCWSTSHNPTTASSHTTDDTGTGTFTSVLVNLNPNTTYYVRAYATNSAGTSYGEEKTFNTPCNTVNIQIAGNASVNFGQSVTLTASGASTYTWSTGQSVASITVTPSSTTTYSVTGTDAYGCTGTASKLVTVIAQAPVVTTTNITGIGSTSAASGGNVTSDGGATVTARGVCWSTSINPTTASSHTTDGTGTGTFTSVLANLNPNTTYYVRAYATNSAGTSYGEELYFTTNCESFQLNINGPTSICSGDNTTLTVSGAVTYLWSNGVSGNAITVSPVSSTTYTVTGTNEEGCQITSEVIVVVHESPTIYIAGNTNISYGQSTSLVANGATYYAWSSGDITSAITVSPTATTTYTVTGTSEFGCTNSTNVTVNVTYILPTVTTDVISNIDNHSAVCGGSVVSDGGAPIMSRGVCWSTSPNPTTADNHTTDGIGEGDFTSMLEGLEGLTLYYVRAYATNSEGTAYGNERIFSTTNVGIDEHSTSYKVTAFPNPTYGKLTIQVDQSDVDIKSIVIFDTEGRKVKEVQWTSAGQTQDVDLTNIKVGIYYIKLLNDKNTMGVLKIVKQQ